MNGKSLLDRWMQWAKDHPVIAAVLLLSAVVIGVANTLESAKKIIAIVMAAERDGAVPVQLPRDTGWIFLGYFSYGLGKYTHGPFYAVVESAYPEKGSHPHVNDTIRLTVDRPIVIAEFATKGLTRRFDPPWRLNVLSEDDYTGLRLSKGSVVQVRDVSLGAFEGRDGAVWARIGAAP